MLNDSVHTLTHLKAELQRIDVLIQREVRRLQVAGRDPVDTLRGLYVSDSDAEALLARPFGTSLGQTAELDDQEVRAFEQAEQLARQQTKWLVKEARRQGKTSRLLSLTSAFQLDEFEVDALLVCLAPHLDLRYERLYGYLQDDVMRKRPTVNLLLDLLCEPGPGRLLRLASFNDDAPLFRYQLLERLPDSNVTRPSLLSQSVTIDESLVSWLLGGYQAHASLGGYASLEWPQINETDSLLAAEPLTDVVIPGDASSIAVFHGPDEKIQVAGARLVAANMKRPLLVVNLAGVMQQDISSMRALRLALRDARLTGAIPCLMGWESCLVESSPPPALLAELYNYPDLVIVASTTNWQARGIDRVRHLLRVAFPEPSYSQRGALWHFFLREDMAIDPSLEVADLASQFILSASQIRDAVASARDRAFQHGRALNNMDLFVAARSHSSPRLAELARKIVPRYQWDDIVLPPDQRAVLREIISTVRGRPMVLHTWGVGQKLAASAGVTAMFAGPPGTGKTMAAEVIAGELGLDLYKIDLSTVINKYIGETEKNLGRIFDEASSSNAILFFDEADSIFGKRSEVKDSHDRYANIEVSYLLQRMESYDGITILATNLRANLDEAFTRRFQFAIDLPFPDEVERLHIWQTLFPPEVPRADDLNFGLMARRFKFAGGSIRNIIVSAAYLAATNGGIVTMEHLLHGTRRELQKMGRLISDIDLTNS
ncbi:MAG: ATP-binding protein [Ardenticatenales bacterium]|nr:ATP-binding protein [Ardenticatenales bacterium]